MSRTASLKKKSKEIPVPSTALADEFDQSAQAQLPPPAPVPPQQVNVGTMNGQMVFEEHGMNTMGQRQMYRSWVSPESNIPTPMLQGDTSSYPHWKKSMMAKLIDMDVWRVIENPSPTRRHARSMINAVSNECDPLSSEVRMVADGLAGERFDTQSYQSGSTHVTYSADDYARMENKAFGIILTSIAKCPEATVVANDVPHGHAYELWNLLAEHFEGINEMNQSTLLTELTTIKMKNGEGLSLYVGRLKGIVLRLQTSGMSLQEGVILHHLINGLESPKYDDARRVLNGERTLRGLTFAKACHYLRSEEIKSTSEKSLKSKHENSVDSNFAQPTGSGNQGTTSHGGMKGKGPKCFRCQQYGHIASACTKSKASNGKICVYCGLDNHEIDTCKTKARADALKASMSVGTKPAAVLGVDTSSSSTGVKNANCVNILTVGTQVDSPMPVSSNAPVPDRVDSNNVSHSHAFGSGDKWHLDSGAGRHNGPSGLPLMNATPNDKIQLRVAGGELLTSPLQGDLTMVTPMADRPLVLKGTLTHDRMSAKLLSVSQICLSKSIVKGVWFDSIEARVYTHDDKVLLRARQEDGVYVVDGCQYAQPEDSISTVPVPTEVSTVSSSLSAQSGKEDVADQTVALWHARCGHLGKKGMDRLVSTEAVDGLDELKKYKSHICSGKVCVGCVQGKSHRAPLGKGTPPEWLKAVEPMDRWHVDSFGPFSTSLGGKNYLLLITDEASDKTFGFTVPKKSDEAAALIACYLQAKTLHGRSLKELHSDGGGEFMSNELKQFLTNEGIRHTVTMPHTPQQNPRAERKGRTIVEMMRTMLHHAQAPVELWGEAAKAAVYIRNLVGIQDGHTLTANQRWHPKGSIPMKEKITGLHVMFCDAWVHLQEAERDGKLGTKAHLCIFVGYAEDGHGYRFFDVEAYKTVNSRDAKFVENEFTQCALLRHHMVKADDVSSRNKIDARDHEEYLNEVFNDGALRLGMILSAGESGQPTVKPDAAVRGDRPPTEPCARSTIEEKMSQTHPNKYIHHGQMKCRRKMSW